MRALRLLAIAAALAPATAFANANIVINVLDAAGEGFNDPTPAAPIGGNPGVTVGAQRLIAFQAAADIWGDLLDSSVTITIDAFFDPLTCTANSAVLGSAGTNQVFRDFGEIPATWYHGALTNKIIGFDAVPTVNDLTARFNSNLGNPGCLTGIGWYLGLDANHGTQIDLITVLLHEFGHGLGFSSFVGRTTGAELAGFGDIFEHFLFDNVVGMHWDDMTNGQRLASITRTRRVGLDGPNVVAAVPTMLANGTPMLNITAPAPIAAEYLIGPALFGPPIGSPISAPVAQGFDATGSTLGCAAIVTDLTGRIALLDRGTCSFKTKVLNAQAQNALAVLIVDNVAGNDPGDLADDPTLPAVVTIPAARVTMTDGTVFKQNLATLAATLQRDFTRRQGADTSNRGLIYTPNPSVGGSSISHWDVFTFPNTLMEPFINADLPHSVDLTLPLLRDIGWYPDMDVDLVADGVDNCPSFFNPVQTDLNGDGIGDDCSIIPRLECVTVTNRFDVVATFGYDNPEVINRSLPIGNFNYFYGGTQNMGQPTTFLAGDHSGVFQVSFTGLAMFWFVGDKVAIATPYSDPCP